MICRAGIFKPYNEKLADLAGHVGFPLVGLCFARRLPAIAALLESQSDLQIAGLLMIAHVIIQQSPKAEELYKTVLNGAAMAIAAYFGKW